MNRHLESDGLLPREPAHSPWWNRAGLTPRAERHLNRVLALLILLFAFGWGYGLSLAFSGRGGEWPETPLLGRGLLRDPNAVPTLGERLVRNPLSPASAPLAPRLTRESLRRAAQEYAQGLPREARGLSGAVYAQILPPEEEPRTPQLRGARARFRGASGLTDRLPGSGIWEVVLEGDGLVEVVPNQRVIRQVPMSAKQGGRIGGYRIGEWPCEVGRCPEDPIYQTPRGMIEVTPQNQEVFLSEHLQLKDFITKLQENVWPKYVVVDPQLLDKIELVVQELERTGHPVENLFAVSGFRSPWYNASGGNTAGRGGLSRHMYGDAMDIAVDNNRDGVMDDLNGDGRIGISDARVIGEAVERVEERYPELVGGMHYYPPTGGHQGMVHIDTRGRRARW